MTALPLKLIWPALLLAACSAFISPPAEAGIRKCDIPSLTPKDAARARAAAKRASKGKLADFDVTDACRYPGGANVVARTPRLVNAEGAQEWWYLFCSRHGLGAWSCDKPHAARAADMGVTIDGIERHVQLSYVPGLTLPTLRALVQRAFALYYDPAFTPESCTLHGRMLLETDWTKPGPRERHARDETEICVSADLVAGSQVEINLIGSLAVNFTLEEAKDPATARGCWGEILVID